MLSKKLLTLACVAGILAFGGCIFIPSGPAPQPTAPRLAFQGIHLIEVSAANSPSSHHVDPADLAQAVTRSINDTTPTTGIKAQVQQGASSADADLKITILNETATPPPDSPSASSSAKTALWNFQFNISATLTNSYGQVVWSETNAVYSISHRPPQNDQQDPWSNPAFRRSLTSYLGNELLYHMFYKR